MELPCITLHTKDRDGFLNCDGYQGVVDSDLETLLQQCHEAVHSLEAEIEKRQNISRDPPLGIRESCEKLQKSASNVRILGRLDVRDDKLVKSAVEIMTTTQKIRGSKVYQVFLQDIFRHCGSALTLLCAASLGKQRIISLNGQDRTALVHYVKCNKASLSSPALDLLAREYEIPTEISMSGAWLSVCKAKSQQSHSLIIWQNDWENVSVVKISNSPQPVQSLRRIVAKSAPGNEGTSKTKAHGKLNHYRRCRREIRLQQVQRLNNWT